MTILLFGKNGQVGWELQRSLAPLGKLVALCRDSQEHCGDLEHPDEIRKTVRSLQPSIIVNAAAYTAVDRAQDEPALAHAINTVAPAALAEEAKRCGALLIHYSTDYVFDGSGEQPWRETDTPVPRTVYGTSKLEGEYAIRATDCRHLIFRTSWVYAARGSNFALTMLRLAGERDGLKVVADQIGAPTSADLIADVTAHTIRQARADASMDGIYHLAANGETSWHGYACFLIECARQRGMAVRAERDAIQPIKTSDYSTAASRPFNSRLNTTKLRRTFDIHLPPWQVGVERTLAEIAEHLP